MIERRLLIRVDRPVAGLGTVGDEYWVVDGHLVRGLARHRQITILQEVEVDGAATPEQSGDRPDADG